MTTPTYNRLMARKILGAITHLLHGHHAVIPTDVLRRIISAHLRELQSDLPQRKFGGIVSKMVAENDAGNAAGLEFAAGLDLLVSMIPTTYGMIPAGASIIAPQWIGTSIKRKDGLEIRGELYPHPAADVPVVLI